MQRKRNRTTDYSNCRTTHFPICLPGGAKIMIVGVERKGGGHNVMLDLIYSTWHTFSVRRNIGSFPNEIFCYLTGIIS